MNRKKSKIDFVGLHAHSGFSLYDGFDLPQEHMNFSYENGSNALALTDHGHANGQSYQILHAQKMKKEGKIFKPIFGVEAYFVHSIKDWYPLHERVKQEDKKIKAEESSSVIEDENATKSKSKFDCLSPEENRLYRRSHLILLAQNQIGLNNIYKLISESYRSGNFFRFPRIDIELLRQYNEGIIVTNACAGGVIANDYWNYQEQGLNKVKEVMKKTITSFTDIIGDRFYGEIQWNSLPAQHDINHCLLDIKDEMGIKLISTADSHYPSPEKWKDRELYKRLNPKFFNYEQGKIPQSVDELGYELYPKNGDQMWESFKKYSQLCGQEYDSQEVLKSFENTCEIAYERIEDFEPDTTIRLPNFVVPKDKTADETFEEMAWEGLRQKQLKDNPEYVAQLQEEIDVIKSRGFSKYFLTMKSIIDEAEDKMLIGNGRGSAAGSLTSYVLGITQLDPKKFNLLFSRFLRSDQTDMPDIDTDFAAPMDLKEHLINKWGDNNVVPITNWNKLSLKSVIKDVAKFYGIPFKTVNEVTKKMLLEAIPSIKKERGIKSGVIQDPTFEELIRFSPTLKQFLEDNPEVGEQLNNIVNQVKSSSRHAGGLLIGENLDKHMPLIYSGGVRQTPWSEGANVRHLEPLGFIKFDILGLATLAMFEDCIKSILKNEGMKEPTFKQIKDWYDTNLHPDKIDLNDQNVYKNVFEQGNFAGTFQFTENFAQRFCKSAAPKNIVEISAITSIARPGPMGANVHTKYLETKEGKLQPKYYCKEHKEITEPTYGFLVFQEQIMLLAHKLGKEISLEDGGKLEKALRKKRQKALDDPKIKQLKEKFTEGCLEKGMTLDDVEELWNNFASFAQYGFNLAHATCYSIISYQCAWLLTHYPHEWMAAFLNKECDNPKKREKAIGIAKSHGFMIRPVEINTSERDWIVVDKKNRILLEPFKNILGLGDKAIEEILEHRPFNTIEEFLFHDKMEYRKVSKRAIDPLCKSGALRNLQDERFFGDKHFWASVSFDRPKTVKKLLENIDQYKEQGQFSRSEKIDFALELSGQYPVELVLSEQVRLNLAKKDILGISDFEESSSDFCWFILRKIEVKTTRNGKGYLQLHVLDDGAKEYKIKCWGEIHNDLLMLDRPYLAKLEFDSKYGFSVRGIKRNFRLLG